MSQYVWTTELTWQTSEDLRTGPRGVHKHPNHDLVDLVVLETELVANFGGSIAQESTELLHSTFLLLL